MTEGADIGSRGIFLGEFGRDFGDAKAPQDPTGLKTNQTVMCFKIS